MKFKRNWIQKTQKKRLIAINYVNKQDQKKRDKDLQSHTEKSIIAKQIEFTWIVMLESDEERLELLTTGRTREWMFESKRRRFWVRTTLDTFDVLKYYFLNQVFFSFLFCYILKMVFFFKKKKKKTFKRSVFCS